MKNYEIPNGIVDVVLDTDMAQIPHNGMFLEVDDHFALAYLLKCEKLNLKAIYTDVATSEEYKQGRLHGIKNVLKGCNREDLMSSIFTGAETRMPDKATPVESEAVEDLIKRANNYSRENPLYVIEIGPFTNI